MSKERSVWRIERKDHFAFMQKVLNLKHYCLVNEVKWLGKTTSQIFNGTFKKSTHPNSSHGLFVSWWFNLRERSFRVTFIYTGCSCSPYKFIKYRLLSQSLTEIILIAITASNRNNIKENSYVKPHIISLLIPRQLKKCKQQWPYSRRN